MAITKWSICDSENRHACHPPDGSHNFPNAQIYISQADLEFWTDDKWLGTPAEGSALAARKNLIPNRDRIVFY